MKRRQRDYLSAEGEPALGRSGGFELDPSEQKAERRERLGKVATVAEIDALRDSVLAEPSLDPGTREELGTDRIVFADWLAARKLRVSFAGMLVVTLLAGIAGGPFAVFGALARSGLGGVSTLLWLGYALVLGPLIEEMLKQSGSFFLL